MSGLEWAQPVWAWVAAAMLLAGLMAGVLLARGGRATGPRWRVVAAWLVRGLLVALVLAAVAGPTWTGAHAPGRLVVLVDRSASMPPGWSADILRQAGRALPDARIVAFSFPGQGQAIDPDRPTLLPADPADGSDPGPASQFAAAVAGASDWLLLSDGNWTSGATWPAGRRLWAICPARGRPNAGIIDLSAWPAGPASQPAATASTGAAAPRYLVRATLSSTREGFARVRLTVRVGEKFQPLAGAEQRVRLEPGQLRSVDWPVSVPPGSLLRAELAADLDELPADNQLVALVPAAEGQRTAVLLTTQPEDELSGTLSGLPGWQVLRTWPDELSRTGLLEAARPPDAVVLDNLPADALPQPLIARLKRYVESGGGLLTVGGASALAAGHYYDSPLEALLPVICRPRIRPPAAIVLVLDRSGSMKEPPTLAGAATAPDADPKAAGMSKLDLLKQAVISLPDLFAPGDRLAVVGFADNARTAYVSPPNGLIDWQAVRKALLDMQANGSTAVEPAIKAAADWLAQQDCPRKHLLLLTDGKFSDLTVEQAEGLLDRAARPGQRLTVSTFAASEQAERRFLADLADRFAGTYYPPERWGRLRQDFRDDLAGATVDPILTGPTGRPGEIAVRSDTMPPLPPISRMLTNQSRPPAHVWYRARVGQLELPLVTVAPIGAGRSAVIATALHPDWTAAWTAGDRAGLLTRLLDDLTGQRDDPRLLLHYRADLARQHALRIDVFATTSGAEGSPAGRPINMLDLSAELVSAAGVSRVSPLPQVGPGQYGATAEWLDACRLLVVERTAGGSRVVLRRELAAPLPAEMLHLAPRPNELDALCRLHGGRLLDSPEALAELKLAPTPRSVELWPWLLLAAVALWLADVVITRAALRG